MRRVLLGVVGGGLLALTACGGAIDASFSDGGMGQDGSMSVPTEDASALNSVSPDTSTGGDALVATPGACSVAGCGDAPTQVCGDGIVGPGEPCDGGNVHNQVIDKIDLLFDIDNSASMGDKQTYLAQAIPDLINRLLTPNCVDAATGTLNSGPSTLTNGVASCAAFPNTQPEFPAVHNLHLGIVTSSLGQRLSEQQKDASGTIICNATAMPVAPLNTISSHNDDQGHLVARSLTYGLGGATATEGAVGDALVAAYDGPAPGGGFLDWFPTSAANAGVANSLPGNAAVTAQATLVSDFTAMVTGAGIYGCGIESQLESWYRFLVQPDPYASFAVSAGGQASWSGVDTTILQERADFLRPDSLVAVIVLTDENDSEVDVRSLGGAGYLFMGAGFQPPMATAVCATNPADPGCTTQATQQNPNPPRYTALNDWGFDPNLRHVHMRQKYGIDPQYPWQRYVLGLTSPMVPDRLGEYPSGANNYVFGQNDCTNPLFAASLPSGQALMGTVASSTLCNLPAGTRTKDLIFYAIIGGVPNQLLHFDPTDVQKSQLSQADWVRILGTGPRRWRSTRPPPTRRTSTTTASTRTCTSRTGTGQPSRASCSTRAARMRSRQPTRRTGPTGRTVGSGRPISPTTR